MPNFIKKNIFKEMKIIRRSAFLIFILLLFAPSAGYSQDNEDPMRTKLIDAAREIMTSAGTCALITVDREGRPRVRTMDPFLPESDLTVWFGTNPGSRKVDQIRKDPRVTLYYLGEDGSGYVMIHGMAQLVNDREEKEKRWKAEWEAFYPGRPDDYLLIRVTPEWMEVISYAHGISGDPITWEPPRVQFDSK